MVLNEILKKLTPENQIEFLHGAYFGVDGVWFLVCEELYDFDTALNLDDEVWRRFAKILAKRVKRMFNIEGDDTRTVADTIILRWTIEKWKFEVIEYSPKRSVLRVLTCPWLEGLKRSHREKFAPKICDPVCETVYHSWSEAINPKIKVEKPKKMGEGDEYCDFIFMLED
jgi:predicted hydrocarbon binding protein